MAAWAGKSQQNVRKGSANAVVGRKVERRGVKGRSVARERAKMVGKRRFGARVYEKKGEDAQKVGERVRWGRKREMGGETGSMRRAKWRGRE